MMLGPCWFVSSNTLELYVKFLLMVKKSGCSTINKEAYNTIQRLSCRDARQIFDKKAGGRIFPLLFPIWNEKVQRN